MVFISMAPSQKPGTLGALEKSPIAVQSSNNCADIKSSAATQHAFYSSYRFFSKSFTLVMLGVLFTWQLGQKMHLPALQTESIESILREAPLTDGHNDFPIFLRSRFQNHIHNITEHSELDGQVDFPRLRQGQLRAQFWSVFVPCPQSEDENTVDAHGNLVHDTLQQIDLVHSLISAFPNRLRHTTSSDKVWHNFRNSDSISSLIGAEGLHQIGNSASVLRMYHRLGMRYVTLTHDCHNRYADSAAPAEARHHGVSGAGALLLHEMNRIGMIIDLSHTSVETMRAALNISAAPVIFSHSSSYTLCPHHRNVPDDVLFEVKENGGVVMVTFVPEFVNCDNPEEASLSQVADHVEYIGNLIGFHHVGIGGDYDGISKGPRGLEDVSRYPDLIRELKRRGVSQADLIGVIGANVLRVLKDVELVAKRMSDAPPLEDNLELPESIGS